MSKKSSGKKQVRLNPEEVKHQEFVKSEQRRLQNKIKTTFYPMLLKHSKSIEHAKLICQMGLMILQAEFSKIIEAKQRELSDSKLVTLDILNGLKDKIGKKGQYTNYDTLVSLDVFKDLFTIFADEKIAVTEGMIKGMQAAIDSFVAKEVKQRKLSTLNAEFI